MKIPEFETRKELFDFLLKNQNRIIADKKAMIKYADACSFGCLTVDKDAEVDKANKPITEDIDQIKVRPVINTTNLMDSHDDVHIPGLWTKSLKENKDIYHDQEHRGEFSSTISDYEDLKAYVQDFTWKELGQKYEGSTQALVFESVVRKDRNEFMFNQYKQARVRQHSVGMRYVKVALAMDEKGSDEGKVWDKYIEAIANKEQVQEQGYFFAVTEAKVIEGSAVKRGSNWVTPTLDNNMKTDSEPSKDTHTEPPEGTQFNVSEAIKKTLILI